MEAALLLRAAIPPRSARKGAALRERWAQQVGLTNALGARLAEETSVQSDGRGRGRRRCTSRWVRQATALVTAARRRAARAWCAGLGAFEHPELRDLTMPAQRGLVRRCLRERRVVLARDVTREPDYTRHPGHGRTCARELDVPVIVDGRPWGVLSIQSTESNAFDEGDASMLRSAAHQLSAGLRAAMLRERLERAQRGTAEALRAALDARAAATAGTPLVARAALRGRRAPAGAATTRS